LPAALLPENAIIAEEKLTQYLLILLPKDDKSKFLAKAGYRLDNWQQLEQDLRTQVLTQDADFVETTRYGRKYCIRACLRGSNGVELSILTVWIVDNGTARFVTLVPDKGANP
jgi:outer membrane receptor for Fe3+-dicitrate